MRSLRGVGILFSLLIVGVLGGVMAPLPSEAQTKTAPSLYLKVDSGTAVNLIQTTPDQAAAACSNTEISAGYNLCYRLKIGAASQATGGTPSRTYQVTSATTGSTLIASLLVADKQATAGTGAGTGISDKATVTGLVIKPVQTDWLCSTHPGTHAAPCANHHEPHILTMTLAVKYDFYNNPAGPTYQLAMVANANFVPPALSANTPGLPAWTVGNSGIVLDATIGPNLTPTSMTATWKNNNVTPNPTTGPLRWQFGGTGGGAQYYALAQTNTNRGPDGLLNWYPNWPNCNTGNNLCDPLVTATYTVTLYGLDSVQLLSSNDFIGGGCNASNNAGGTLTPQGPPCFSNKKSVKGYTDSITQQIDLIEDNFVKVAELAGSKAGTQCVTDCPCYDETCLGTIVIKLRHSNNVTLPLSFPFSATGPDIALSPDPAYNFVVNTDATTKTGETPFPNLFVGNVTAPWTFTALVDSFPTIVGFTGSWKVDSINCESDLNEPAVYDAIGNLITPAVIVSTWETQSGSDKRNATVTKLGKGDVVTCSYHAHKNSSGN